jgi:hypothetical protein
MKDKMGRKCGTYGGKINTQRILVENVRGRDHLDDLNAVGMIILKWIFSKWVRVGMAWMHASQNSRRWRDLVDMEINSLAE